MSKGQRNAFFPHSSAYILSPTQNFVFILCFFVPIVPTIELRFSKDAFALITMHQLVLDNFITFSFIQHLLVCLLTGGASSVSEKQEPHPATSSYVKVAMKDWNATLGSPKAVLYHVSQRAVLGCSLDPRIKTSELSHIFFLQPEARDRKWLYIVPKVDQIRSKEIIH